MKQEVELQTIPTADEKTFTAKLPIRIHMKKKLRLKYKITDTALYNTSRYCITKIIPTQNYHTIFIFVHNFK